ncbi:MAG TPA: PIN domain-containing protein [Thermoanaerobaculia bacterium]|nr:PIN domain-containing protein [Thermoanaerobaculia bacterium]
MDRVFLDANVLFSAAYREGAGLLRLWELSKIELTTSAYAAEEARRNLESESARARLAALLARVRIVPETAKITLPGGVAIAEKDEPIIRSAIAAGATHLLTGDLRDFGRFFGKRIGGVLIQTPADYLRRAK